MTARSPIEYHPDLEALQPDEAALTDEIVGHMAATQAANADRHRHAHRDAHAKSHAIIKGCMTVHGDLPAELAQGIFAVPRDYPVVARLSSAPGDIHSDAVPAPRGFAIKVIGVGGGGRVNGIVVRNGPGFRSMPWRQPQGMALSVRAHAALAVASGPGKDVAGPPTGNAAQPRRP